MDRKALFEDYWDASYKRGNILNRQQFDKAAEAFDQAYKGYLPSEKTANILDFGCGCGHFLFYLKKKGYTNVLGVDISKSQVDYCRRHVFANVREIDGMTFLFGKKEHYDVIAAHDVQEHIPKADILEFLRLTRQALRPGGVFITRVPNMSNPFGLDARYSDFTHEIGFTEKSLFQVLWSAGFRDITVLPPRKIAVKSFKNLVRRLLVAALHQGIRWCFYIQDYSVPRVLDKNLTAVARR